VTGVTAALPAVEDGYPAMEIHVHQ